jgi:hypothetical protein
VGSTVPRIGVQHSLPEPASLPGLVLRLRCYLSHDL